MTPKRRRNREIGELVSVKSRGLVKETLVMWYVWIIRLRVHWHRGQAPAATLTSQFPSSLNSSIHHHAISRSPGFIDDESSHINKVRAVEKGLPTRCDPIPNFARTKTCRISSQWRSNLSVGSRPPVFGLNENSSSPRPPRSPSVVRRPFDLSCSALAKRWKGVGCSNSFARWATELVLLQVQQQLKFLPAKLSPSHKTQAYNWQGLRFTTNWQIENFKHPVN